MMDPTIVMVEEQGGETVVGVDELHDKIPDKVEETDEGIADVEKGQTNPQPRRKTNKQRVDIARRNTKIYKERKIF